MSASVSVSGFRNAEIPDHTRQDPSAMEVRKARMRPIHSDEKPAIPAKAAYTDKKVSLQSPAPSPTYLRG